jgi:hypothetical protein
MHPIFSPPDEAAQTEKRKKAKNATKCDKKSNKKQQKAPFCVENPKTVAKPSRNRKKRFP